MIIYHFHGKCSSRVTRSNAINKLHDANQPAVLFAIQLQSLLLFLETCTHILEIPFCVKSFCSVTLKEKEIMDKQTFSFTAISI